ncbi:hypothetical protein DE146DRAFT_51036 [Phaeosphaeria sp. MPI-PUGE-AT-0046c]|nr:hypothetical protein DE146DRAFT_51036 [Phaeosphaeria sp. MPI-PUGE-AT-0046c]
MSALEPGLSSSSSSEPDEKDKDTDVASCHGRLIDVADASRVLECVKIERQLCFQHIVRHYLSQILYGCKSAYCTTPTCLSCQKRNPPRPIRPPTQLTARALANYLAGQDNPRRGLCPHEMKVAPGSLEIDGAVDARLQTRPSGDFQFSAANPSRAHALHTQQRVVDAVKERHQTRKDAKSLSQNLYDSVTMICAYSKQLSSPASVLETLQSAKPMTQGVTSANDLESQTKAQNGLQSVSDTRSPNESPVTHPVNLNASVGAPTPPKRPLDISHNGQRVHRIPYHPRERASSAQIDRSAGQTSLDTSTSPKATLRTVGKSSFDLNVATPAMARIKSPSLPLLSGYTKTQPIPRADSTLPVLAALNCSTLEELKDKVYDRRKDQLPDRLNYAVDYDTNRKFRPSTPFVNRSLFYTLSNSETLLRSFHDVDPAFEQSPLPHLDSARLIHSFRDWTRHNGALVFDSLCMTLKALYTHPPELHAQKSPRLTPLRKGAIASDGYDRLLSGTTHAATGDRFLDVFEAAHIVMICIHALTSSVSIGWPHTWAQLRKLRGWGIILPTAAPNIDSFSHPYLEITDELEYEPAIRLTEQLLRAIGARTCFEHILLTMKKQRQEHHSENITLVDIIVQHLVIVERVVLASKQRMTTNAKSTNDPGWTVTATLVEWLKTVITKRWDNKPEINKWSSVGTAVILLDKLCTSCQQLNLREEMFTIPFLNERLDAAEEIVKFMSWEEQPNTLHVFQYPVLFAPECLVKYFRTINLTTMMAQYNHTTRMQQMQALYEKYLREPHNWLIRSRMKITMSDYLVLNVSREEPLKDTLDQLWGVERRTLLKPLKVKMGQDEGEVGADHGGVTYEFFRVVLSEAFKPDHGMFTLDPQTRMIWFQPGTLEPDWRFEMIGMLFSLAVYNGVTLPVTFPLAMYQYLLAPDAPLAEQAENEKLLSHISDGWPALAKSFETLLKWSDGDVSDTFLRDYDFSYEAFGQHIDHNMEVPYIRPRQGTAEAPAIRPEELLTTNAGEAKLVTNENREAFVRDYVNHLTYLSVLPQLRAFHKGFLACLQPQSLRLFSPRTLRNLIEGQQNISISDLHRVSRYEQGYSATHPTILSFWTVVGQYDQEDRRHLLEFVTASDRVPVTGYEGITFHVVRVGDGDMLPTSSTCFGKLYLPEYDSEETLKKKLILAIRNSKGFGVV